MRRPDLVPDCSACAALCCVATSFERSEDFAFDKPAGVACRYLTRAHRCAIHADLVARGCRGCAVFDCYGAGQRAMRAPAHLRHEAFLVLRGLHEQIWLLTEAAKLCPPSCGELRTELTAQVQVLDTLAHGDVATLLESQSSHHERRTRALLCRVGQALGGCAYGGRPHQIGMTDSFREHLLQDHTFAIELGEEQLTETQTRAEAEDATRELRQSLKEESQNSLDDIVQDDSKAT